MRITSKGQVTIPVEIREKFGLLPYTEGEFVVSEDKVILTKGQAGKEADHPNCRVRDCQDDN